MDLERLEAGMMQKDLKQKIVKGCLQGNIRMCCDNIKMCLKATSFDFELNSCTITQG